MAGADRLDAPASRYGVLLAQGTFYNTGQQLSNVSAVLPFILSQRGTVWAAALLYPAFSIGTVVGNAMSPLIVERSRQLKHLVVVATSATMATLVVCTAMVARTGVAIAVVFLAASWAFGAAAGIASVAFADLVSDKLPEARRGGLFLNQGATGAVVAIVSTLLIAPLLAKRDPVDGHVDVLWLGAVGFSAAAIAAVFIGPVRSGSTKVTSRRLHDIYREGMAAAHSEMSYHRFVVIQLLFVPVSLGTTFFSLHAAEHHGGKAGSLHILVIFSSIGLVFGALLWRIVYLTWGVRGMLVISALLSCMAAVLCIVAQAYHDWSKVWVHGIVFLLTTVANEAIFAAGISWISVFAAERQRATLIAFVGILIAVESSLLGAALGGIAAETAAIWPVTIVLAFDLIAAVAATGAPARE